MLRILRVFFVFALCVVSIPAAADEPTDKPPPQDSQSAQTGTGTAPSEDGVHPASSAVTQPAAPPPATPPTTEVKPPEPATPWYKDWQTFVSGYFRAPLAIGISSRASPDDMGGPPHTQLSYGPNRTVDASYYAFTYTRLQEQDWVELFVHEKHKHVEAVIGWMGNWYQSVGVQNPYASWVPGMAYITLDTDFGIFGLKPNIALTMGAWWPRFGHFEKYDTYTLGRFRQMGEQVKVTLPMGPDMRLELLQGFGTNRDGTFTANSPELYAVAPAIDLITYENLRFTYKKNVDIGLHTNNTWTADPNLDPDSTMELKSYTQESQAHMTIVGAEANLSAPFAGRLWVSPSYINVKNGWALGSNGGTEVMHGLNGAGVATNYLGLSNAPASSTGSGSIYNLGFLYENTLSVIQGKPKGSVRPEVTLSVFGLLADANLDLPAGSNFPQSSIKEFKYGADVTVQALDWLAVVLRYDTVNMDLDHPAYVFNVVTPRLVFFSHFLSGERIYLQYSRYTYGDKMVLSGTWPWGTQLVAGNDVLQAGPYAGMKPDMDVVKLQADISF